MIKKRKWLYFVFGILMLMVMPGFEDNKIQAQTSVGELLIAENKLEGDVTEWLYGGRVCNCVCRGIQKYARTGY